jgi:hypothetical protein
MTNSNDTIGNRTRDLSACSTVPQTTAPPGVCRNENDCNEIRMVWVGFKVRSAGQDPVTSYCKQGKETPNYLGCNYLLNWAAVGLSRGALLKTLKYG